MIYTKQFLKNLGFTLPVLVGVAHAEIPDNVKRFKEYDFACQTTGRLQSYDDQQDLQAKHNPRTPLIKVFGPGMTMGDSGFVWTGPNSVPLGFWGESDESREDGEKAIQEAIDKYLPASKFPGIGTSQSIVVSVGLQDDISQSFVKGIAVLDNQLLAEPITVDSPSGTITTVNFDTGVETFRCSPNRGSILSNRGWVEKVLLDLEPRNWRPSLLAAIQEDPTFSVFSDMVAKAGLNDYFNSLDAYDGLILPSNGGIRNQFEKQIRKGLPNREIEPSALRAMVDRKVSELLDTDSQKLQEIVLAQVVKKGYNIGDGNGKYEDGNGASVSIGRDSPQDFGVNNGLTINGDRNCDVDFRPIQTKQGIIYPSLCLRAVK